MGDTTAQNTKTFKLLPGKLFFLRTLDVSDVDDRSDVASERITRFMTRHTVIYNPSVLPVRSPQPVLDVAVLWRGSLKGSSVAGQAGIQVIGMHPGCPTVA